MKILLIDPPFYRIIGFYNRYFPYGLLAVGTAVRSAGHEVMVYDADYNENPENIDYARLPEKYPDYLKSFDDENNPIWIEVKNTIQNFNPDIIGISAWTTYAASTFHLAGIAKEVLPDCPVVCGGPHAAAKADEILNICPDMDYVIRGEGENALLELIEFLSGSGRKLSDIPGLSFRSEGKRIHNPSRDLTRDLDAFPMIDRTLLMNEKSYTAEDMGLVMTSRGCPFACTFCATNTRRVSLRSVDKIITELRFVKKRYGTTQFTFKDDSFTVNAKRVRELCAKLIDEKLNINWQCNTRVNLVNEDMIRQMKKAGCNSICIGIESGSERILREMNKGITHEQIRNAVDIIKKVGIHVTGYFMMGIPGETEEDIYKTLDYLYEIKPDLAFLGVYEPFPGTRMFDDGIKRGLVKPGMTLDDFYTVLPNLYYVKDPGRHVDTIEPARFTELENEFKQKINQYNKNIFRVFKTGWTRIRTYMKNPSSFLIDIKRFLSYR